MQPTPEGGADDDERSVPGYVAREDGSRRWPRRYASGAAVRVYCDPVDSSRAALRREPTLNSYVVLRLGRATDGVVGSLALGAA
jgi:hypothetical protein